MHKGDWLYSKWEIDGYYVAYKPITLPFIIFFISCMIFLPSFPEHDDFIQGNEEFKLGVED